MEKGILVTGILLLLVGVSMTVYSRAVLKQYAKRMTQTLDQMIAGKCCFEEEMKETLLGRQEARLRVLYDSMAHQAEQHQRERQAIETVISDISHQIKTPMAVIKMNADLLKNERLPLEKRQRFFNRMVEQVDKMDFLIESMLKCSRLETGVVQLSPNMTEVRPMIESAVCSIALKAESKNILLKIEGNLSGKAYFDRKWTEEALLNILDNAIKYTQAGGVVTIQTNQTNFFLRILVKDNGCGIAEKNQPEIFKRFYRVENTGEGVGLGLYLAREIVERQHGLIEVRSEVGKGTCFFINLPVEDNKV